MRMASTNRAKDGADLLCIIGETDRIKANGAYNLSHNASWSTSR
jgi:hypothetical protein